MAGKERNKKSDATLREEQVLEFWHKNKIFSKTLSASKGKKEFVFYDGPVTANSLPVLHTMAPFSFKDCIPRYKTMRGFHVRRKGGWDTHGLPVELQVEKKLGLNSKKAIEEYGVAKFNQECRESVWEYIELWKKFTNRIGYWADQENPYVTYDNDYIESVWNVVKEINNQKLLYKDYKVVPWCPRCGTALSSHELAQGYEDVKDLSIYAKFKIVGFPKAYFLAWTTTPWTLPGNIALAVGKDVTYVEAKVGEEILVLAKDRLSIIPGPYEIIAEHKGSEMVGMEYEPLFPFLKNLAPSPLNLEPAYKVYAADFVNTVDGTGIVHTAVMYGQDDFELGTKVGLPKFHLVNPEGKFIKGTGFLEGRFVKEKDDNGKPTLDIDIIKYLTEKNLFFNKENYQHSYPHCWRCHTALIYYARDSWYIKMSDPKVKEKLISENKQINWEPAHTRDGRFGEWLREIKDWAISRERYWGTPLPVWEALDSSERFVVSSLQDLKKYSKKSSNKYFLLRHGESEKNLQNISNSTDIVPSPLTPLGQERIKKATELLTKEKIDYIFVSPLLRTQQSAKIVAEILKVPSDKMITDSRLIEINTGEFDNKPIEEYEKFFSSNEEHFTRAPKKGETLLDVKKRVGDFIYEVERKFTGKNILIISHEDTIWMLESASAGLTNKESLYSPKNEYIRMGELRSLHFTLLPCNENYELDLHKPFIDEIVLVKDGKEFKRTKEVLDVWLDSGCMPFAQDHYPFSAQGRSASGGDDKKLLYPADYICEAIDQTRGWFYTLHAVGVLMSRGKAYKNVICLGHLLDVNGKKMSKSLGNIVDPWEAMDKYGVDTLRLWMYSVNQPGESKNFDEKTVALLHQQVFGLLYNVLAFYELYKDPSPTLPLSRGGRRVGSKNILDVWILSKLDELVELSTKSLDSYKLLEPTRAIRDFIGDLSTWYLRRSRERIKEGNRDAKSVLCFVLKTLAKLLAPLAPFTAEDIWLKLRNENDAESVHLENWPKKSFKIFSFGKPKVLKNMERVRNIVTLGLEARQKAKIQVRQPLSALEFKVEGVKLSSEYLDLIKDELNVKEVLAGREFKLNTRITPALKAEGDYREFMRELQDERKKRGLKPGDKMPLTIDQVYKKYKIPKGLQEHMLRVAAVGTMICDNFNGDLPKDEIATACLLHDMGNIIKFKLDVMPELLEPQGGEYWQAVKDEYIAKYGSNEYEASVKIAHELGVSEKVITLIKSISFAGASKNAEGDNFGEKIVEYCDDRVGPFGVVSLEDRLTDLRIRYAHRDRERGSSFREIFEKAVQQMEQQIFSKCKIKPEDINDDTVAPIIEELKNFVIK